jgi:hypothetical protein
MILFEEDWSKYPQAIVDLNTSNKSFVRLSILYREMGIKNNTFMLALLNPDLVGVDPFDPNLTLEQIGAITVECKLNFWYFLREIARAPGLSGSKAVPIRANRGNIALYWLFGNHITVMLVQIRQTGKSFSTDVLMAYLLNIRCQNTQINLLTKDDDLRGKNIRRIKDIDLEFPYYLRQRTRKDSDNTENVTVKRLGNTYFGHLPQKSPKLADNVGRGLTSAIFQADEAAYLPNIGISLPAALGSGGAARDRARDAGEPYGTILTTTAGKKDDRDGKFIYGLLMKSAPMTEHFYDCKNLEELELVIKRNSVGGELRVNCTYSHSQLGYTDAWLKRTMEDNLASGEAADRDYFNIWTSGNATHPLSLQILERIRNSQNTEYYNEISPTYGYITRWYIDEHFIDDYMANNQCMLGMDTSDASGGDDISLFIININTGETVAAGNYNETNLIRFSEWVLSWFIRFSNLVGIIERRSTGAMLLDYLIWNMVGNDIDPFSRLFNRVVNDRDEYRERFKEITVPMGRRDKDIYVRYKKLFGFATSGAGMASRSELYSTTFQGAAKTIGEKVKDKLLIDQIAGLTSKNGRVDHLPGEHDDLVIAWLLTYWFITQGRNMEFYKINSRQILSNVTDKYKNLTAVEIYDKEEQNYIRTKIEEVYELMLKERDPYILQKYELQIKVLSNKLILEENERFSVDDLMRSLAEEKRRTYTSNRFNNHQNVDEALIRDHIVEDVFTPRSNYYY